jgi:hypothetical protein
VSRNNNGTYFSYITHYLILHLFSMFLEISFGVAFGEVKKPLAECALINALQEVYQHMSYQEIVLTRWFAPKNRIKRPAKGFVGVVEAGI